VNLFNQLVQLMLHVNKWPGQTSSVPVRPPAFRYA
jgi:hypothetical protein